MSSLSRAAGRVWGIVPAAGFSRRMGRPKLLLPVGTRTVIRCVLDALEAGGLAATYVLVRADDAALREELARTAANVVTTPHATHDMRRSVELLLDSVRSREAPTSADAWLLSPADHPALDATVVSDLIRAWRTSRGAILVPTYDGGRGHPTLFAWQCADRIRTIPRSRGLNWLLQESADDVVEVPVGAEGILRDLDTPEDYSRLGGD